MNELTPTEAHDIVNPEINPTIKGCGMFLEEDEFDDPNDYFDHDIMCGTKKIKDDKLMLCPSCIDFLKGIISAQEREIEFLDKISVRKIKTEDKRLRALKISTAHLKEVVK